MSRNTLLIIATIITSAVVSFVLPELLYQPRAQSKVSHAQSARIPSTSPVRVTIPKIGVTASIESVGKAADGAMANPSDDTKVAWWQHGAKPGEQGSVVLAGHVDQRLGGPGVFYHLSSLEPDDHIQVSNAAGRVFTYRVTAKHYYPVDTFPLEFIFARQDKPRLNLITCSGSFDTQANSYQDRLVIFTELVSWDT